MPNCFELLDKTTLQAIPLIQVDERICREVLNTEPHSQFWGSTVFNWYDTIGFTIAMGNNLDQTRQHYTESDMWKEELPFINAIIDFIDKHYIAVSL